MKRITILCACLLIASSLLSACSDIMPSTGISAKSDVSETPDTANEIPSVVKEIPSVINVALFKDVSSAGLIKMLDESTKVTGSEYVFDFYINENFGDLSNMLITGEVDIAIVPVQHALELYKETEGGIVMIGINSYSIELAVPDINDNPTEDEPATEITELIHVSGVTVARRDFTENNTDAVRMFAEKCTTSSAYANDNRDMIDSLMKKYGFDTPFIDSSIYIDFVSGDEMKNMFYEAAVNDGNTIPNDDYYYIINN